MSIALLSININFYFLNGTTCTYIFASLDFVTVLHTQSRQSMLKNMYQKSNEDELGSFATHMRFPKSTKLAPPNTHRKARVIAICRMLSGSESGENEWE